MPNRILREGILTSERINALTPGAEVFFCRLISVADDDGCFSSHHELLRSRLYPLQIDRVSAADISKWIAETVENDLIVFATREEKSCLQILRFFQRGSISSAHRRAVLAAGKCARCSSTEKLTVDHIFPVRRGGKSELSNYQCLCRSCNSGKGARIA